MWAHHDNTAAIDCGAQMCIQGQPDGTAPSGFIATDHRILCQSCFNFQILFFGYVNVFTSHVNVVFFHGAAQHDIVAAAMGRSNGVPGIGVVDHLPGLLVTRPA